MLPVNAVSRRYINDVNNNIQLETIIGNLIYFIYSQVNSLFNLINNNLMCVCCVCV